MNITPLRVLDAMNIFPSNPVVFMAQSTMKSFASQSAKDHYKLVAQATLVSQHHAKLR
ncbi:hypothetical protein KIPB_016705, partial [Kipferlia bialata]|eukprot:g16705.t1